MGEKTIRSITENTTVSIGVLVALIGGAGFVTYIASQSSANASAIQEIKAKQSTIENIQTDVAVIKEKVEGIERALKRGNP